MSKYRIKLDDDIYEMEIEKLDDGAKTSIATNRAKAPAVENTSAHETAPASQKTIVAEGNVVRSPMPGTIIKINSHNGDRVEKGQVVLILEAMKMENEIIAPMDGIVDCMTVDESTSVQGGDILFNVIEG